MLTAVDHIVLGAADLLSAIRTFHDLGFHVSRGEGSGSSPRVGYAVFDDFYLELRDLADVSGQPGSPSDGLKEIALRSDDLEGDVARVRSTGLAVSDVVVDAIDGAEGSLARRSAMVDLFTPVRLGVR